MKNKVTKTKGFLTMAAFILLASIPLLATLGHDLYLLYLTPNKDFEFSALGFIWTKYHPESYKAAIETIPTEHWETINTFLTFKAFYIGTAISVFFFVIISISHAMNSGKNKSQKAKVDASKKWKNPSK